MKDKVTAKVVPEYMRQIVHDLVGRAADPKKGYEMAEGIILAFNNWLSATHQQGGEEIPSGEMSPRSEAERLPVHGVVTPVAWKVGPYGVYYSRHDAEERLRYLKHDTPPQFRKDAIIQPLYEHPAAPVPVVGELVERLRAWAGEECPQPTFHRLVKDCIKNGTCGGDVEGSCGAKLMLEAAAALERLAGEGKEVAKAEKLLGAFAVDAMQCSFKAITEWAMSAKIEMANGEPIIRIAHPSRSGGGE